MNKKKIIFVVILVLFVAVLVYFFSSINNNKSYVDKIDYDMEISFSGRNYMIDTGYAGISDYILINTQTKIAHYINHYHVMVDNSNGGKDKYKVKKFKLNNSQLDLLIEYSNKPSEEANNDYIKIEYNNKTTILNESSAQEILNFIDKR